MLLLAGAVAVNRSVAVDRGVPLPLVTSVVAILCELARAIAKVLAREIPRAVALTRVDAVAVAVVLSIARAVAVDIMVRLTLVTSAVDVLC